MATKNQIDVGLSGSTGTGNFVGSNTPTLVTPVLGVASATSINFGQSNLNFYEDGTFNPTITFSTPGDLSVVYTTQSAVYRRIGNVLFFSLRVVFTPTYTTASGTLRVSGFPYAANSSRASNGNGIIFQGAASTVPTFPAGTTYLVFATVAGQTYAIISASGSATDSVAISTTSISSGVQYDIVTSGNSIL